MFVVNLLPGVIRSNGPLYLFEESSFMSTFPTPDEWRVALLGVGETVCAFACGSCLGSEVGRCNEAPPTQTGTTTIHQMSCLPDRIE